MKWVDLFPPLMPCRLIFKKRILVFLQELTNSLLTPITKLSWKTHAPSLITPRLKMFWILWHSQLMKLIFQVEKLAAILLVRTLFLNLSRLKKLPSPLPLFFCSLPPLVWNSRDYWSILKAFPRKEEFHP